jgi:hypothetical protein
MNDLQTVRAALTPDEPSQDVVDRSRHKLQNRMLGGPAPRRRTGWLAAGTGLIGASAAVVAILATQTTPVDSPQATETTQATKTVSGQEILLAAADRAQLSPEGTGTYWHTTVEGSDDRFEYWTKADGQTWFRGAKTNGAVTPLGTHRSKPFSLVGIDLTFDELRALPKDPDALKTWIAEALKRSDAKTSAGRFTESDRKRAGFQSLISLVSALPAAPEVRAAAFRAIASYPGVKNLGAVPGGQGLELPEGQRLVVDPATGRVNRTSIYVTMDGALYSVADGRGAKIDAEWVGTLPA